MVESLIPSTHFNPEFDQFGVEAGSMSLNAAEAIQTIILYDY